MPSPSTAPNMASAGPSQDVDIISMRAKGRVTVLAGKWGDGRQGEELRRRRRVRRDRGDDPELQDLTGRVRIGHLEVLLVRLAADGRLPAAEGLVRSEVAQHVAPHRDVGEVDDEVSALGQPHEKPVAVGRGQVHGCGQEATLVADGPDLDTHDVGEVEDQEAGLAAVEEAQPVAALLDDLERPRVAVDHDRVAEELRVPDRGEVRVRDEARVLRRGAVEELAAVGVEEGAVLVERPVLDRDRDLVVGLVGRELVSLHRRGPGQHGRGAGASCRGWPSRPGDRRGRGRSPPDLRRR